MTATMTAGTSQSADTTGAAKPAKTPPVPRNGVDTPALFATIDLVRQQPEIARFQFRAEGQWVSGTHSRTTMSGFYGAGAEMTHTQPTVAHGDHPAVLCGGDNGPTPVEWLLHALAACLTAGIGNIAAARGVTLESVSTHVEGDIDLQGILGLSKQVRNGFQAIRVTVTIRGDAPADALAEIVRQSVARSAVYDVLTNGAPVEVTAEAA
jgi:uncharacterized OsmC-like protein